MYSICGPVKPISGVRSNLLKQVFRECDAAEKRVFHGFSGYGAVKVVRGKANREWTIQRVPAVEVTFAGFAPFCTAQR